MTSFGAHAGEGWGLPSGPFSGGFGLPTTSMMTRIGSLLPIPSWALPLAPKSFSAGAVTAIREPTVAPVIASASTGLRLPSSVRLCAPPWS